MVLFHFILNSNFTFALFWGMVMFYNVFETKEKKILTKDKIESHWNIHMVNCTYDLKCNLKTSFQGFK